MGEYRVAPLEVLIEQFEQFPSIGHKTASRLAYHVLSMSEEQAQGFSKAVVDAHKNIRRCSICCNLTDTEICSVCSDDSRDKSIICVVEDFPSYISQLTESGVETYASTPRNAEKITDVIFSGGVMLIGNEGNGLSEEAVSACKKKVMIQMSGRAESLNAASAASILMWEMFRRI